MKSKSSTRLIQKSFAYFDLLDALQKPGCPVCYQVVERSRHSLASLFYEHVTDVGTRQHLRESQGFCAWHAWMATEVTPVYSSTGLAIIYKDLLDSTIAVLENYRQQLRPLPWWQRWCFTLFQRRFSSQPILAWYKVKPCPQCAYEHFFEQIDLELILDWITDPEFAKAFTQSSGLCLPHLLQAIGQAKDPSSLAVLIGMQLEKWRFLSWELAEFWRKHDYRFAHEPKGAEQNSWLRVVASFVGKRGVFGSDLRSWFSSSSTLKPRKPVTRLQGMEEKAKSSLEE